MDNQTLYWSLLALTGAYALVRGGVPERWAMAAWILASILSTAAVLLRLGTYETVQFGVLAIDVVLLAFLIGLSLKADRYWPLWMTGFHLWGIFAHLAKWLLPTLHPAAYAIGQAVGSYAIIGTMVLGTWKHRQRLTRRGVDNSWSGSFAPFVEKAREPHPKS